MDRRLALLALWVAFVVAAVGVGFGAAGLVGDPFTDGVTDAAPASDLSSGPSQSPSGGPTGAGPSSAGPSGGGSSSRGPTTKSPTARNPTTKSPSSKPATTSPGDPGRSVTRSITTRAGLASATCNGGSVRLGASPAVGWQIQDIDAGPDHEARVRFEPTGDGDDRVEVKATCSGGSPRFELDDDGGEGGEDGGGDGD